MSRARTVLCASLVAACGSSGERPATTTTAALTSEPDAARRKRVEQPDRAQIVASHRKLESRAQDALAATCDNPEAWAAQHCTPSCYPPEPKDARAGTKLKGRVEIQHRVCQRVLGGEAFGTSAIVDEIDNAKLVARQAKGKPPKPHKKGSWQAEIATWFAEQQPKKLSRRDVVRVLDTWREIEHPVTREPLRCVTIAHHTTGARGKLDGCGATGRVACEASGNAVARAINLAHFRLAEARRLFAATDDQGCHEAATAAVAAARGLPRWRQYQKLNIGTWTEGVVYETRFDGVLDEDQLFAAIAELGAEAERLHAQCTGAPRVPTTVEQEQSFHSCPAPAESEQRAVDQ